MNDLAELLAPPSEPAVSRALAAYRQKLADSYGDRFVAAYLFGSRARGDHRPDSDADVAVVLKAFEGTPMGEKMRLIDLAFDALTDAGLMIQPWPFTRIQWEGREPEGRFADLLASARRDGKPIDVRP
ncbi:nucleotidyltransferase domain-containing protein [Bosea sp. LjRoot237]|uniref:nucleotidyltransferase domain-containing protein n=1 Tax=Bosea sp. LjRoot237 TaxID=3342292 RepID=UPI003ECFBBC6